jgi:hypothetical protein
MRALFMVNIFLTALLLSFIPKTDGNKPITTQTRLNSDIVYSDASQVGDLYVSTGFYFLANKGQGVKMRKDHSDENYDISNKPFVSVKNILRTHAQKNIIQQRVTYGVTIVLDNQGAKYLEEGTGNPAYPYMAVVIANRLLYVVENTSKIKTGIMNIVLVDYTEKEVNEMVDAINKKK